MHPQYPDLQLFVDGDWIGGAGRDCRPVVNPADEDELGALPCASTGDVDRAVEAAARGFAIWRAVPAVDRGRVLKRAAELVRERAERIARLATMEEGKPLRESRVEALVAADTLEWFAEEGRRAYGRIIPARKSASRLLSVKEPVGPVAAFAPWNFPIINPARKIGAALAAGCSCILKPPEEAPASALEIARAVLDAGLPPPVLSVLFGDPDQISRRLLASDVIRKVSFTGSIAVGKHLMTLAAQGMKRTTMELGGHAPVLVFDDVDLDKVLDVLVTGKFRNAGQVCVAPTRFIVQQGVYDRFVSGFAERAKRLVVGNGLDEHVEMGPLAHSRRMDAISSIVENASAEGAVIREGGSRVDRRGFFWAPTVLADVPASANVASQEPFGPIAVVTPFAVLDEALATSNSLPYGLAAFVFTRSARQAQLVSDGLEAGMVGVNTLTISHPETPFGGVKESGHGYEDGVEGLEACLITKLISEDWNE